MSPLDLAREAANSLDLLDSEGRLHELDSLTILDLVEKLESLGGLTIPTASLRQESFASLEAVAELLEEIEREVAGGPPHDQA